MTWPNAPLGPRNLITRLSLIRSFQHPSIAGLKAPMRPGGSVITVRSSSISTNAGSAQERKVPADLGREADDGWWNHEPPG